ncbi:aldehyde dehydrogenase [Hoyosella sp. YIM 151337]|uniref:aldehyde dehydrogenase n=1 Tax=Hoyosella sp. YIM 151337 TaxID=2992742 RepID=UPI0022360483|nr:aldehyde dehydrogenase [Hoyosella sp. YIM 151337]MCW4355719.1 aldehyde dehydrogenase [Hoyosella sp. YIM 151337]
MREYKELYIGGHWAAPSSEQRVDVISPHSEETVGSAPAGTPDDIDRAVAAARQAFDEGPWPQLDPSERLAAVQRITDAYNARQAELSELISSEMGAPLWFSQVGQVGATSMALAAFLNIGSQYQWEERRTGFFGQDVVVRREPAGVAGLITPWNVPHFTTISKLIPALLAGCTVVLKPSEEVPLSALALAEIIDEAGLPEGVVSIVPGGRDTGEHLVTHRGVDKISFTGSPSAGRRIASLCGQDLRRVTLELGAKSAAIILDDADLAMTIERLPLASLLNSGQACIAQTRILASRQRYDEVVDAVTAMAQGLPVGDPLDAANYIGPMVSRRQQQRVDGYISLGQEEGARITTGGNGMPDGLDRGWYVRPTVFADVDNHMRIAQEEIFGPVLAVIPYDDEADAIRIANDSAYGLGGSVWTSDVEHGVDVARKVRTGTLGINQYLLDFTSPFGGYKSSGFGREFGPEGIEPYIEYKSISLPIG